MYLHASVFVMYFFEHRTKSCEITEKKVSPVMSPVELRDDSGLVVRTFQLNLSAYESASCLQDVSISEL